MEWTERFRIMKEYGKKLDKELVEATQKYIIELLDLLKDDERKEVFGKYCIYCGSEYIPCFCMRDD